MDFFRFFAILAAASFFYGCGELDNPYFVYESFRAGECSNLFPLSEDMVDSNASNPQFWYYKGLCNVQMGRYGEARADFLQSKELRYRYVSFSDFGLAISNFNLGNEREAYANLRAALDNGLPYAYLEHVLLEPFSDSDEFREFKESHKPSFDLWTSFLMLLAIQGFLLAIYIMFKGRKKTSNLYLGLFIISFCLIIGSYSLSLSKWKYYFPYLNKIHHLVLYSLGPFLYFYFKSILTGEKFSIRHLAHFLPIPVLVYFIVIYKSNIIDYSTYYLAVNPYFKIAHLSAYGIMSYLLYFKRRKDLINGVRMWTRMVIGFFGLFILCVLANALYLDFFSYGLTTDILIAICISIFIFMCILMGYVQPQVFSGDPIKKAISNIKYGKSGLSQGVSLELKKLLLEKMESQKLYLDSELNLESLSEEMGVSRRHVSQVINENFHLGFYDFVNRFRIEEAKRILVENNEENQKIQEVAYKVGFNNKASFYSSFKKFTNATPKEYLRRAL